MGMAVEGGVFFALYLLLDTYKLDLRPPLAISEGGVEGLKEKKIWKEKKK